MEGGKYVGHVGLFITTTSLEEKEEKEMIDFILAKWLMLAAAYGIIYATYVVYALFALRFKRQAQGKRVTEDDFYEVLGEAFIGPILLPCRIVKNCFSLIKTFLLGMVNAGLPK